MSEYAGAEDALCGDVFVDVADPRCAGAITRLDLDPCTGGALATIGGAPLRIASRLRSN